MLAIEKKITIGCTPDEFLDLVMDVERYQHVDDKIKPVDWARREGNLTEFKMRPKLAGLPSPKVVQQVRLTPSKRIDIQNAPTPLNRLASFHGSFACTPTEGGTEVTRRMEFDIRRPFRWILEPLLRRTLPQDVERELAQAKNYLEGSRKPD